jgi:hypothetical protein
LDISKSSDFGCRKNKAIQAIHPDEIDCDGFAILRAGIVTLVGDALGALISIECHVRCEVKTLNGIPIVTTPRQGLKHFIAIESPVWQQIHQLEHEACSGALALWVYGVAPQARIQDDIAEWPNIIVTGIKYRSP